jgi:hypothetical protein
VLILVISRGRLACELVDGATINMGGYHPFSWELWKENKRVEGTQIHSFSLFLSLSLSLWNSILLLPFNIRAPGSSAFVPQDFHQQHPPGEALA